MKRYLYFAVFSSGMTTLALEFTASRLLGRTFGTSNLVWASIIGLILIYLAVGYFWGGRWADRSPYPGTMYAVMAWGAFIAGLVPGVADPVLRLAADAFDQLQVGILFGSFAAVLVLLSIPVTLLGMVSPFAIRLGIEDPKQAGQISGRIYAISTLGSFIGTFLPELLLTPLVGTNFTFLGFSFFLLLVALVGLGLSTSWGKAARYSWMVLVLLGVGLFLRGRSLKDTQGMIYETESAYNYIQVLEIEDGSRWLRLNEGQGVHSVWHPTDIDYDGPWEQFLAAPFFNPSYSPEKVESMAIVGLAAGTVARQATAVYGPIHIDGYEIDAKIIQVGREFFGMDLPNLNAIAQDGRWGLAHSPRRYTIIAVDAYRPPYIPWHLTTREFFRIVYDHLTPDGALAINVGRSPNDRRLIDGLVGTIQSVFPSVYVMDVPYSFNSIIYATAQPTQIEDFYANLVAIYVDSDVHPLLRASLERVVVNLQPTSPVQTVFTDDLAPIEWITNSMVLSYVFLGNMEELQQP